MRLALGLSRIDFVRYLGVVLIVVGAVALAVKKKPPVKIDTETGPVFIDAESDFGLTSLYSYFDSLGSPPAPVKTASQAIAEAATPVDSENVVLVFPSFDGPAYVAPKRDIISETFEAAVNVIQDIKTSAFGTKYDAQINAAASAAGIDPQILFRLLRQESHFREDIITGKVRSPAGALGIAQFMPATAREWLGSEANALKPEIAINGAARYLAWLIRQLGSVDKAIAAYNWGIGNVQRKGLANAPAETVAYVSAITGTNIHG